MAKHGTDSLKAETLEQHTKENVAVSRWIFPQLDSDGKVLPNSDLGQKIAAKHQEYVDEQLKKLSKDSPMSAVKTLIKLLSKEEKEALSKSLSTA